jgi:succinyl-CoA synthetase alpha subunit/citrate synthase
MRARVLSDLLKKGDRVAVSNITGREASKVSVISQNYCGNIVGGWALGRGGQKIETAKGSIPVFATFEEMLRMTPAERSPNKILIYSPPEAVYGEVKEVLQYGEKLIETIYVITERVSIEVTAKIYQICHGANIDVVGCNTLGIINSHDGVRIGAVGGDSPAETFKPGLITIISNSGNMVNTISSYLLAIGMGTSFGLPTGKDKLILFPVKDFLTLTERDEHTKLIVLYVEPGGTYEHDAIEMMRKKGFSKPVVVYVGGEVADRFDISLGHAGAVVEGKTSMARSKKEAFDTYFGLDPFNARKQYRKTPELSRQLARGIRVQTLHHIPNAVTLVMHVLGMKRDRATASPIRLNPWFINLGELGKHLPSDLVPAPGCIPEPYDLQVRDQAETFLKGMVRQPMRNASHASSNDGATPRIYGYSLIDLMQSRSLTAAMILYWTGELPQDEFEEKLAQMTLVASLTNGPGTISAQGAKLSASAGNSPNTAMIATMAAMGFVHGGNGAQAVRYLLDYFGDMEVEDPYRKYVEVEHVALAAASDFKKKKNQAREAGIEYERIPCLGHPVFRTDPVNYDPREQVIDRYIRDAGKTNVFLDFYHLLARALKDNGCTKTVLAVNLDAAIACVWLALCWQRIRGKQMTLKRAVDIPFIAFALGRVAGGAGEFLDHQDYGTNMDMRVPVDECKALTRPRTLK